MNYLRGILLIFCVISLSVHTLQAQNCENFLMSVLEAFEDEFQDEIAEAISDIEILQEEPPQKPEFEKIDKADISKNAKKVKAGNNNLKTSDKLDQYAAYKEWKARRASAKDRMNDKIDEWQQWWSDEFGSNWASVGPRALNINDSGQNGNLAAGVGTVRMFYTEPNIKYEDVKIAITKTGGSQKGWMIVCRYHAETPDHAEFVGEVEFDNGKGNIRETKEIICEDCAGYHLSVKVRKNAGTNNFSYRVSTEGMNPLGEE